MNMEMKEPNTSEFRIREMSINIDLGFESSLGIYGPEFWHGVSNGSYERTTFDFIEEAQRSGIEYFLDIGAATGCMSLFAASTGMKVLSVEPQELVFSALTKNLELNPSLATRVTLDYALVQATKEESKHSEYFTPGAAGPISFGGLSNKSITMIELLDKCPKDKRVAIKIDIEGAEFPLFSHKPTIEYLAYRKPLVFIALHPGFRLPLKTKAKFISRSRWRLRAAKDILKFYLALSKYVKFQVAPTKKKVKLIGIFAALAKDEKDFLLIF